MQPKTRVLMFFCLIFWIHFSQSFIIYFWQFVFIRDILHNLVQFVQFKKCVKHPCRNVTFSKIAGLPWNFTKRNIPSGVIFMLLNCANRTKSCNAIYSKFHIIFNRRHEINKVLKCLENINKGIIFHFWSCHIINFAEVTQFY